jgi:hypothetical protein
MAILGILLIANGNTLAGTLVLIASVIIVATAME